jgi:hypothetical protein
MCLFNSAAMFINLLEKKEVKKIFAALFKEAKNFKSVEHLYRALLGFTSLLLIPVELPKNIKIKDLGKLLPGIIQTLVQSDLTGKAREALIYFKKTVDMLKEENKKFFKNLFSKCKAK